MPFLIADRFPGVSPADVPEWDADMVEDALARIEVETEYHREQDAKERRRARIQAAGGIVLDDDFPDLE